MINRASFLDVSSGDEDELRNVGTGAEEGGDENLSTQFLTVSSSSRCKQRKTDNDTECNNHAGLAPTLRNSSILEANKSYINISKSEKPSIKKNDRMISQFDGCMIEKATEYLLNSREAAKYPLENIKSVDQALREHYSKQLANSKIPLMVLEIKLIEAHSKSCILKLVDGNGESIEASLHYNCIKNKAIASNSIILLYDCSMLTFEGPLFVLNITSRNLVGYFKPDGCEWILFDEKTILDHYKVSNLAQKKNKNLKQKHGSSQILNTQFDEMSDLSEFDLMSFRSQLNTPSKE